MISDLKDFAMLVRDTADYLVNGRFPPRYRDRLKLAPEFWRTRHIVLWMNRVDLEENERKRLEEMLAGRCDPSDWMPQCDNCQLPFDPNFKAHDGIRPTRFRCTGCVRALEKEKIQCTT